MSKITQEDRNSLRYFHEEKGDITRWVNWEDKKELFFEEYPELRTAIDNLRAWNLIMNSIIAAIDHED